MNIINSRTTFSFLTHAHLASLLVSPVIYSLIIPFVALDLWICLYQGLCFPIYKIAKVKRSDYVILDRGHLKYLSSIERLNCYFCRYINGLIAYVREIASRSEQYFCPIKHAKLSGQETDPHYRNFLKQGDSDNYEKNVEEFRKQLQR